MKKFENFYFFFHNEINKKLIRKTQIKIEILSNTMLRNVTLFHTLTMILENFSFKQFEFQFQFQLSFFQTQFRNLYLKKMFDQTANISEFYYFVNSDNQDENFHKSIIALNENIENIDNAKNRQYLINVSFQNNFNFAEQILNEIVFNLIDDTQDFSDNSTNRRIVG